MPIGKSGKYFMNPNEMKRQGDMPDAPDEQAGMADEAMNDEATDDNQGDGLQHHQIDEQPDGTAHSTHTNADGTVEEMDHPSYEDACAAISGEDNDGEEEGDDETGGKPPMMDLGATDDMAGMYDKAGRG